MPIAKRTQTLSWRQVLLAIVLALLLFANGPARCEVVPEDSLDMPSASGGAVAPAADSLLAVEAAAHHKGWGVRRVDIEGAPNGLAREIRDGLALSGRQGPLGPHAGQLYPETIVADFQRTRLFLARHGYPYARVTLQARPSDDKQARRARQRGERSERETVDLLLQIVPGPAVTIESATVDGVPAGQRDAARASVQKLVGQVWRETRVEAATRELIELLRGAGHAHAKVGTGVTLRDSSRAAVGFLAEPGPICTFREITVEGAAPDLVPLVRKTMHVRPGRTYSPGAVADAQDHLRLLDLFRQIRLSTVDVGPDQVDLRAELIERPPRSLEIGVGYWSEEYLKLGARWAHRNLFWAGRGIDATAAYSLFKQTAALASAWPALFGARTRGQATLRVERQDEESYETIATELDLTASYRPTLLSQVRGGVTIGNVDVRVAAASTEAIAARSGRQITFTAGWSRDNANDRLYPTAGAVTWLSGEVSPPGMLSQNEYARLEASLAGYRGVLGGAVLAGRISGGWATPLGDAIDLLPNKRFYAGGSTSMRGFRRRKLGPLDAAGAPLGGEAKLEVGAELRFPLWNLLRGAVFADAGQVWLRHDRTALDELELAVGPGLMVQTPVGPVRADVGYRLTDRQPEQPRAVFQIAIGNPF